MSKKKIFLITHGEYSDYSVVAAFSTKKRAQKALDSGFMSGDDIEEFELDPVIVVHPLLEEGWRLWWVRFDKQGNVLSTQQMSKSASHGELTEMEGCYKWSVRASPGRGGEKDYVEVALMAFGEEHAIKSANEKRAMVLSNPKLWNPDYYHNNENFYVHKFVDISKES